MFELGVRRLVEVYHGHEANKDTWHSRDSMEHVGNA